MTKKRTLRILVGLLVLGAGIALYSYRTTHPPQAAAGDVYDVKKVIDGDTIQIIRYGREEEVRLIGMDTPETLDPRKPVQCFGREASAKAHEILDNKRVRLEYDPGSGERDKYNRILAYVWEPDGTLYNQRMISLGYAHEYTYQSQPYKYQVQFKQAEASAKAEKLGFWGPDTCNGNTKQAA